MLRGAVAGLSTLVLVGVAACAGPPSGGPDRSRPLSQSHNNVFIVAREPDPSMSATQLVLNYLQALTGDQKDPTFSVAQDYLTDDARRSWSASGVTKIVDGLGVQNVSTEPPGSRGGVRSADAADPPPQNGAVKTVYVSTQQLAELDEHGYYKAMSASDPSPPDEFTLKFQQGAGWRIQTAPKERLITEESFKRVYQTNQSAMPVYLPHSNGLAVDQVYLTQATGKVDYTYDKLAEAVLNGRSSKPRSTLRLDETKPVTLSAQGLATVTLQTPAAGAVAELAAVRDALVDTFTDAAATPQLIGTTPLQNVQVTYPGCTGACAIQPVSTTANRAAPPVYWVCPADADKKSTVVFRVPGSGGGTGSPVCGDPDKKVPLDASKAVVTVAKMAKDSPIAVRQPSSSSVARTVSVAAVVQNADGGGSVVVTDQQHPDTPVAWYNTSDPARVTDLEWDPTEDVLWVVDGHALYRVSAPQDDKPAGPANADSVVVPGQAQLIRFKPSPDGGRAVLVVDVPASATGPATPWPAAIARINRETKPVSLDDPTPLLTSAPTSLVRATDAAWADGRTVVLTGSSQSLSNPVRVFKVYSDGSQDSMISDSGDAQPAAKHLAAATSILNGRPGVWVFSDGAGPASSPTSYVYFKGRGSAESYQESGSSPVVATVELAGRGS